MFKVGQKVVCVDDKPSPWRVRKYMPVRPRFGHIYTVRSIHIEPLFAGYGVRLEELINPSFPWANHPECEWSFHHNRFRALLPDEQDAAIERRARDALADTVA